MAPLTPFISEAMYQHLRPVLPEAEQQDSVHYLSIPEPVLSAKDVRVEEAVRNLQRAVELGRIVRDNKNVSMKLPLRTAIVASPSAAFLDDVRTLEEYLKEELNVRTVEYEPKPAKYVRPVVVANPRVLARKMGKKFREVAAQLLQLTPDAVDAFERDGSVEVCGERVQFDEVTIEVQKADAQPSADGTATTELAFEGNVVVVLDLAMDRGLIMEGLAREVINRFQRLRKAAGLVPQDKVDLFFELGAPVAGQDIDVKDVIAEQSEFIQATLLRPLQPIADKDAQAEVIQSDVTEVNDQPITVTIAWPLKK
eukprot:TRINITY_DN94929_c0_g1_i1.p2 TRINITY_DN94929_c0_g1~~TRINITY_DN94929_c0_g1_i1.p2  ORF type:complete len:328 (+),score=9.76 TRINITY_DN94929_c0_g1_i1:52-984(+)